MSKKLFFVCALIFLSFVVTNFGYCLSLDDMFGGKAKECKEQLTQKERENQELLEKNKQLQILLDELKEKNAALTRDYQTLEVDRNNLLSQTKNLISEKEGLSAAKEAFEKVNEQNKTLLGEKEAKEQEAVLLIKSTEQLKSHIKELMQDKARLEDSLKQVQSKEGDKIGQVTSTLKLKFDELQEKYNVLKKDNVTLMNDLKQTQKDAQILEKNKTKLDDKIALLESQLAELEKKYDELYKENRDLVQQAREFPNKFADLARQNKRLIEQAADRHYNLGVFYVKNKEYKQAVEEFNKVLEVKPQHAYANYNLGYIYSEYLVDRKKAIEYFKNYLTYAPDAKDADWVRKYILTWQTWYGKQKM